VLALIACAAILPLSNALAAPAQSAISYPVAPRGPTVDDYHGVKVVDPYRWLEELDSAATRAWVAAEGALTDRFVAALPMRKQLRRRIARLYDYERYGVPFHGSEQYFYTRNSGLQNQSVLYTARGLRGKPRVLLDPNILSKDGSLAIVGYVPSRDGQWLAYGISVSGSDWTEWHVRNVDSGRDLPEVIRHSKYYAPVFSRDGTRLYYSAFPAPAAGQELSTRDLGNAVYVHQLGAATSGDRKLLEIAGHPDWQYWIHLADDGRWLVATVGEGQVGDKSVENVYLIDLTKPDSNVRAIAEGFHAAYEFVGSDAGQVYFLTTLEAPNGKIVALDTATDGRTAMRTVIEAGSEAIALSESESNVSVVDHQLIVQSLSDAHSRVRIYDLDGRQRREVSLPGAGTVAGFQGLASDRATFYSFTDLTTPETTYSYDPETGVSQVYRRPGLNFDPARFEQRQVFFPAGDGTRIPMLLAYRKGIKLDGGNPLLLYGYGGFGIPILPGFDAALIAWLEAGGVYALANIRGGGEYGEQWHQQANRAHKQVVFDDFIAAAQWLIAARYTSTPKLAIRGESNGGLLVGACLTQRPELYGAVIAGVGVMDMLRFDRFGQGAGWTGEYGSPQAAADFPALYAYSPLHHVRPGTHYPATLVITGDHDTRVMPAHSFKFAAALQSAQAGDAPILLYIEKSSGHGGGPTVTQAIDQNAAIYAFLAERLGMTVTR
jgi:prolyl oligopeptidase